MQASFASPHSSLLLQSPHRPVGPGSALSTADFVVLATVLSGLVSARDWVVFSGSIPPGCAADQAAWICD